MKYLTSLFLTLCIPCLIFSQPEEIKNLQNLAEEETVPASPQLTSENEATDTEIEEKTEPEEMDALRKWIQNKRLVTVKEIGGDLSLSGEVRAEFQTASEKKNGISQRGSGGATSVPSRGFDVEVNLMLDYRTERGWAAIKLELDNDMGIEQGTLNRLSLEKAYLGGRILAGDTFTWDIEIGRRFLLNVFDSKVEFGSLFDGVLFRFSQATESWGDFYANIGALLVNEKKSHFAYIAELGLLRMFNTGLLAKVSYVDWKKSSPKTPSQRRFNFEVFQGILGYQLNPSWLNQKLVKIYGATLYNRCASRLPVSNYQRKPWAWYGGVAIGQVRRQWDWAFEVTYQRVQAQAIPSFDASGIGRGNAAKVGFYTQNLDGTGNALTKKEAVGKTNYHGWSCELLYALTNNLTILENYLMSWTLDKEIGPDLKFRQFETELIYAF